MWVIVARSGARPRTKCFEILQVGQRKFLPRWNGNEKRRRKKRRQRGANKLKGDKTPKKDGKQKQPTLKAFMDAKSQPTLTKNVPAKSTPAGISVKHRPASLYLGVWTALSFKLPASSSSSLEGSVEVDNGIEEDQFPEFADPAEDPMNAVRDALAGGENEATANGERSTRPPTVKERIYAQMKNFRNKGLAKPYLTMNGYAKMEECLSDGMTVLQAGGFVAKNVYPR